MMNNKLFHFLFSFTIMIQGFSSEVENGSRIMCFENEREALMKIKDQLGDVKGMLSSWGGVHENNTDCCKWKGVGCDNRTKHVKRLDLHGTLKIGNILGSSLPQGNLSPSLLELKHLNYLDLSNNIVFGPIPEFFGSLSKLQYLNLSANFFSGSIPPHIGNLSNLMYLDLSGRYTDTYSDNLDWISHLHSLEYLDLSYVLLSNATNWQNSIISRLFSVKELHLSHCYLPQVFPSSLSSSINTSTSLEFLDLSYSFSLWNSINLNTLVTNLSWITGNQLKYLDLSGNHMMSGSFPNFSRFLDLRELNLANNQLNGSISEGYLQLPYLVVLDLSKNQITGPLRDLSISSSLKELYLHGNMFTSTSTQDIWGLHKLEILFLNSNKFGVITEAHLSNLSRLRFIDMSSNSFLSINCSPQWIPPFQLQYLSLANLKIGPSFPKWLRTQKNILLLDISNTELEGTVPIWFVDVIHNVRYLNLSNNQLYGAFPDFSVSPDKYNFRNRIFDISSNKFSGSVSFLCHTNGWRLLDLSHNLFSNQIPDCIGQFEGLRYLNLAHNLFSNKIPNTFGSLSSLALLNLRNNSLSGEIPTSMRNCTYLYAIDLGDNSLTGNLSLWIGKIFLDSVFLSLRSNEFYGTITADLCDLQRVRVLDLSSNKISGGIPKCLYNLTDMIKQDGFSVLVSISYTPWEFLDLGDHVEPPNIDLDGAYIMWKRKEINFQKALTLKQVRVFDLSNNNLEGEIPPEITQLTGLVALNLSRNNLTGRIPQNIGQLNSLEFLDFSRNRLSGGIPTSLSNLSLGVLDLSYNNLSGKIPQVPQLLTYGEAYDGNSGLCGCPLVKLCPGEKTSQCDNRKFKGNDSPINKQQDDDPEDDDDELITQGFFIALGLGYFVGFCGIFGTMLFNKAFRSKVFEVLNTVEDFVYVTVKVNKARLKRRLGRSE